MPDKTMTRNDVILVDIPALSLIEMAKQYPEYLGTSVAVYQDCSFTRESGESWQYFAHIAPSRPEFGDKESWRMATAREAVWVNISRYKQSQEAFFSTGKLRSGSVVTTLYNHLSTPPLVIQIEVKDNLMAFHSGYERDIEKGTMSLWLKRVKKVDH